MKNITIALYKGKKGFFGKFIWLKQRFFRSGMPERYARYTHVEIYFDDLGRCFSSSEVDGGVRFKIINLDERDKWDIIKLSIDEESFRKIEFWCTKQVGNAYNWTGIFLAQVFGINITGTGDYFCSQIVTRALQEGKLCCTLSSLFTSPGDLALYFEENGNIIV